MWDFMDHLMFILLYLNLLDRMKLCLINTTVPQSPFLSTLEKEEKYGVGLYFLVAPAS